MLQLPSRDWKVWACLFLFMIVPFLLLLSGAFEIWDDPVVRISHSLLEEEHWPILSLWPLVQNASVIKAAIHTWDPSFEEQKKTVLCSTESFGKRKGSKFEGSHCVTFDTSGLVVNFSKPGEWANHTHDAGISMVNLYAAWSSTPGPNETFRAGAHGHDFHVKVYSEQVPLGIASGYRGTVESALVHRFGLGKKVITQRDPWCNDVLFTWGGYCEHGRNWLKRLVLGDHVAVIGGADHELEGDVMRVGVGAHGGTTELGQDKYTCDPFGAEVNQTDPHHYQVEVRVIFIDSTLKVQEIVPVFRRVFQLIGAAVGLAQVFLFAFRKSVLYEPEPAPWVLKPVWIETGNACIRETCPKSYCNLEGKTASTRGAASDGSSDSDTGGDTESTLRGSMPAGNDETLRLLWDEMGKQREEMGKQREEIFELRRRLGTLR